MSCNINFKYLFYGTCVNFIGFIFFFIFTYVSFNVSAQLIIPKVTISSNVSGASVIIDGKEEGLTPLTLSLRPGNYNLQIIAEGLNSVIQPIIVTSSGIQAFEINMPAGRRTKASTLQVLRKVEIEVNIQGAFVKLGDMEVGQSPFHTNIIPGTYPLHITAPGYQALTTMLIIPNVSNPKFTFKLIPHYVKVNIGVNVAGAFVKLGNIEVGQSPFHTNIIPGTYPLHITAPGYQSLTTMLKITTDSMQNYGFTLVPKVGYLNVDLRLFDDTLETRRGVEFYVDGIRQTQLNNVEVIPGQRNLTLVAGMYRVTRSVRIQPGNSYTIKLVADLEILQQ